MSLKEDKIKVKYSISVIRTYELDEIADFKDFNSLTSDDLKTTLLQMIIIDTIDAIRSGKGTFKILE